MANTHDNPAINHETRDMPARPLAWIALGITLFVPLCAALLWLYFNYAQEPPSISLAFGDVSEREISVPPLMPNPALVVPESIRLMAKRLHTTGWVDREAGIVHIPIEQAMQWLAERGLSDGLFPLPAGAEAETGAERPAAGEPQP
ncbi:MAG: hypothetical protein L0H73_15570 [Nitrococcus sp.]|nr:hypothetical protein [Nitrococcus sp.]